MRRVVRFARPAPVEFRQRHRGQVPARRETHEPDLVRVYPPRLGVVADETDSAEGVLRTRRGRERGVSCMAGEPLADGFPHIED